MTAARIWTWHPATVRDARGPERVDKADEPDPSVVLRPVGFTASVTAAEPVDPLVWEGD